jgi:hypothetical protein
MVGIQTCQNYRKRYGIAQLSTPKIVAKLRFYHPFDVTEIIYTVEAARQACAR